MLSFTPNMGHKKTADVFQTFFAIWDLSKIKSLVIKKRETYLWNRTLCFLFNFPINHLTLCPSLPSCTYLLSLLKSNHLPAYKLQFPEANQHFIVILIYKFKIAYLESSFYCLKCTLILSYWKMLHDPLSVCYFLCTFI